MKPDYFIAHNGLPSILLSNTTRQMIRKVTATSRDNHPNNCLQNNMHHLHRRNISSQNCISKSSKDLINTRLRDGDVGDGGGNKNSSTILSKDSTQKCDNECNRNVQRWLTLLHIYKFLLFYCIHAAVVVGNNLPCCYSGRESFNKKLFVGHSLDMLMQLLLFMQISLLIKILLKHFSGYQQVLLDNYFYKKIKQIAKFKEAWKIFKFKLMKWNRTDKYYFIFSD